METSAKANINVEEVSVLLFVQPKVMESLIFTFVPIDAKYIKVTEVTIFVTTEVHF